MRELFISATNSFIHQRPPGKMPPAHISNWDRLFDFAGYNGIIPVLYSTIKENPSKYGLNSKVFNDLKNRFERHAFRNLKFLTVYRELIRVLNKENIPVIILKGIALIELIYSNPALRPMIDIDLLIAKKDVDHVKQIMNHMGSRFMDKHVSKISSTIHKHIPGFIYKGVLVEYHTQLVSKKSNIHIDIDAVWKNKQEMLLHNEYVYTLDYEWSLLFLCIHAQSHLLDGKFKLIWFIDIALYLRKHRNKIDFEKFMMLIDQSNSNRLVAGAFFLINTYFNIDLGDIDPRNIYNSNYEEEQQIFCNYLDGEKIKNRQRQLIGLDKLSNSERIRYVLSIIFPNINFIKRKYSINNPVLIFFCYIHRIFKEIIIGFIAGVKMIIKRIC
jgi:hypothetical protein